VTTLDLARQMLDSIPTFVGSLAEFYRAHRGKSFPGAPIEAEQAAYVDPGAVELAYDQVAFLLECAGDNLVSFHKTMVEPVALFGPWVCVRATFETSAYAAWLAEPGIAPVERVTRSFAFRYKSLDEQAKFLKVWKPGSAAYTEAIDRLRDTEEVARKQKIKPLKDKNHKTIGLGMQMPTATFLVVKIFQDEPSYRLLSGVAHGFPWISRLVFKPSESDDGVSPRVAVTRQVPAENVIYLSARAVRAFAKALWYRSQQLGWDLTHLCRILEATFDSMSIADKERFWR
jgi:hypothetical protein